ncbi:MAG: hypothetical protein K1X88_26920 [Nannocystaceae bacterium]|nr:hypothetical protein [Nannocystaceae bacterium]
MIAAAASDEVVAMVAARDGLTPAAARQRVDQQRALALAAIEAAGDEPALPPERLAHLLRTARARLLIETAFEPTHRAADIGARDPMLTAARNQPRHVHPTIHHVCQVIAEPPGELQGDALATATADPQWRARATAVLEAVRRHVEATVPPGDPQACSLLLADLPFERPEPGGPSTDPQVMLRGESGGGFDLDACAAPREADGSCSQPSFAPEWTEAVRVGAVPGLRGPFPTRFGMHLALVVQVLPRRLPEDPEFETSLREAIAPQWRAQQFEQWLAGLRREHAALLAEGAGAPP